MNKKLGPDQKRYAMLFLEKQCGPLYDSDKLNYTHLISQFGALLSALVSDVTFGF